MRFRHKLSIVLIGLALVPLVAAGFLVLRLLQHDKVANVDNGLATAVTAGSQAWNSQIAQADTLAATVAANQQVQAAAHGKVALKEKNLIALLPTGPDRLQVAGVAIKRNERVLAGELPRAPYLEGSVGILNCTGCKVVVSVPINSTLLNNLSKGAPGDPLQGIGVVMKGSIVASSRDITGSVQGIGVGEPANASVEGVSMRALSIPVRCSQGQTCSLVAMYPRHIWAEDFTYFWFQHRFYYLATVIDLYSRQIVGWSLGTRHDTDLIMAGLMDAVSRHPSPAILHNDRGSEYLSQRYRTICAGLEIGPCARKLFTRFQPRPRSESYASR